MMDEMDEYHRIVARMRKERPSLVERHPDKWVAMGKEGSVEATAEKVDGLFQKLDEKQIPYKDVVHDFMDSNPRSLLL